MVTTTSESAAGSRYDSDTPFACTLVDRTHPGPNGGTWRVKTFTVFFPAPELASGIVSYRYNGYTDGRELARAALCRIPASDAAVSRMNQRFRAELVPSGGDSASVRLMGCVADGKCVLAPLIAVGTVEKTPVEDETCVGCSDGLTPTIEPSGEGPGGDGGTTAEPMPVYGDVSREEEEEATSCPSVLSGKVIVAGVPVAGRLHTFRFDGPMLRIGGARSPTTYSIAHPTTSEDVWWIAESGTIKVRCRGLYTPTVNGVRGWIGTASYAGESDLHMVMGPGHPAF